MCRVFVYVHVHHRGQKRALDPLELELEGALATLWVLGPEQEQPVLLLCGECL